MSGWAALGATVGLGALGALVRYLLTLSWVGRGGAAAVAIALINSLGCFLIGILGVSWGGAQSALVAAGFVGSLTTLSSLSVDVAELARGRKLRDAFSLLSLHVFGGFAGYGLGLLVGHGALALVG